MLTDNLKVDVRHFGLTNLLTQPLHISGGRQELFAKNITQTRIPNKPDFPHMFTGFESIVGDYCFDSTKRDNEIHIIAVIDKYASHMAGIKVGNNPMRTVIYRDLVTSEVSYFDIRRFSSYTNGYGYENIMHTNIQAGDIVSPDVEIYSSVAKDGDIYKLGVNANVAFITMLEGTEDCIPISQSLADRLSPKSIETRTISPGLKKYPLNLYGDDEQYRIFPDIGDVVNPDGILCAFRPIRKFSAMSDLSPEKLMKINHIFDQKVYAQPGAKVVDVEVYMDCRNDLPASAYEQAKMYHDSRLSYWREIVNVYEKVKGLTVSPKLNTLVTRAMGRLLANKQPVPGMGTRSKVMLVDKYNPVILHIEITLASQVIVNKGHKTSGREGAKGVIIVVPDEEMPIDAQGFRADMCIDPISPLKRTNESQLFEQYINRVLKWQAMHLRELGSVENQFNRIVEILMDINPEYGKLIERIHPSLQEKEQYVNACAEDTIKVCIPPGMANLTKEMIMLLDKKYKTPISAVQFVIQTSTGKKLITTKNPVCIGSKYVFLLSKYPKPIASGYGYVNKCHMPVGAKDKHSSPIGTQPIRFGESESRIFATTLEIPTILRLKCLYSGSRIGPKKMIEALMNEPSPSRLGHVDVTTEELYDDNSAIRIGTHMFNTCGIDIQRSLITEDKANELFSELDIRLNELTTK